MNHGRITVGTYNVHEWIGSDGRQQPARAIQIVHEIGADVIALQEVSFPVRGRHRYSIDNLSRQTGMRALPGLTLTRRHADFGNILLTRHPLIRLRKLDLTVKPREPRGAVMAVLDIHGTACMVVGTHLGLERRERSQQIQVILKEIETHNDGEPLILMGDLNEWNPASAMRRLLRRRFGAQPAPAAYPSRFPMLALDRILIRPRRALEGIHVFKSCLARRASDHLPVVANIRLPQSEIG
ncbi:endonuclease/exonuclease/phosphatase family protein [Desulfatiglans anilini]|uniref:endonuclease/exonuclease/phosphatase family protein n=1 Tax=Desulfatiglans anilini TaxID=90728 RepID=UPI0003FACD32|nr:endonuclease/exonuclease/phosphatase family protein [Desulfatiglans anilini]